MYAELSAAFDDLKTEQKRNTHDYELKVFTLERAINNCKNELDIVASSKAMLEEKYEMEK